MRTWWFRPVLIGALLGAAALALVLGLLGSDDEPPRLAPGRGGETQTADPLAWKPGRRADFEARAAAGLAHVLYAKSPGGVVATAQRVDRFRPLVERTARGARLDPDLLEAIVLLESAGRPDVRASDDLEGAVGLTQILAETGRNLLGMRIDAGASERLTRRIARPCRSTKLAACERRRRARESARRRVDERFDPRKALAATARYLTFARGKLQSDELALVSYHMGVGNLQRALAAYGDEGVPYAQLFFDSTPLRHADAWSVLAALGDDSSTYLWRVYAAREIMRLWRSRPQELTALATGHAAKASAEEVMHPPGRTERFDDPSALGRALVAGDLVALDANVLREHGLALDPRVGELAHRLDEKPRLYQALRPEALALLLYIGAGVREIAATEPLTMTSAVRDERYQRLLVGRNAEATHGYSLHTTGWAFDVSRHYVNRAQAQAFQFWLDRLQALDLIAWAREPGAIHITVSGRARELLGLVR